MDDFMHSKANMNDMVVIEITGLYKKLIIFCSMNVISVGTTHSITINIESDV